jgi:uncharacterized membrane protein YagU involved in acid resistance
MVGGENMRPHIRRTILGGFVGTLFMTLLMRFAAPMMGVQMNIAALLAKMMHTGMAMGLLAHFMLGAIVFALIYAYLLYRVLPGAPAVRGIEWGMALWFLMELLVMPMLGMGVFNSVMGGAKTAMAALIAHIVYGALLGWIAGGPTHAQLSATNISTRAA